MIQNRSLAGIAFLLLLTVTSILGWVFWKRTSPLIAAKLPAACEEIVFETTEHIVCKVDPNASRISLHLNDASGQPWRSLDRFAKSMRDENRPILFAMNAGMYHDDMSPVGLHIENGKQIAPLQSGNGEGNFFMMPNGVFGVTREGLPFIVPTETYSSSGFTAESATQSGPMLVIDGSIHPRFEPNGSSRFSRNGVGMDADGRVIFAISRTPVSFGAFARLFRDRLNCKNALYFDGVVSAFSNGDSTIEGGGYPAGPIVAVSPQ